MPAVTPPSPIPLHLLTGFLGAGKTTLLSALLRNPGPERLAVLVNEVGELALDHWLIERVDEDVLTLASGCVCCSLRGELYDALERVAALGPTRIVVETTGLADPAPILHGLTTDARLRELVRPAGVVAVVDALRAEDLVATQPEVVAQLESADRVVITKADLAPQRVDDAIALVRASAPGCEIRFATDALADPMWLFSAPPLARLLDVDHARRWLGHGGGMGSVHSQGDAEPFETHSFQSEEPVDLHALQLWLRLVTQLDGPRLLRIKGLVEDRATGAMYALQAAGRSITPARRLERPPSGVRGVHMVIIERGMGAAPAARLMDSLKAAIGGVPMF